MIIADPLNQEAPYIECEHCGKKLRYPVIIMTRRGRYIPLLCRKCLFKTTDIFMDGDEE